MLERLLRRSGGGGGVKSSREMCNEVAFERIEDRLLKESREWAVSRRGSIRQKYPRKITGIMKGKSSALGDSIKLVTTSIPISCDR